MTDYVLVPRVLTLEMEVAFAEVWFSKVRCVDDADMDDAYAALIAAAPSPWLPIETAPCDDTIVLAYMAEYGACVVVDLDHDSDPEYWANRGFTHWCPLPEPPHG